MVCRGRLRIIDTITGYEKRSTRDNRLLTIVPLEAPPQIFETEGLWYVIPESCRQRLEDDFVHFMGSIHACEYTAIGMLPLLVMADRNDFGGISIPLHPQTGLACVFIYDGLPGGAGLTRQAFGHARELLEVCAAVIEACPCEDGCPSCVHSPKCGSGNRPISKAGALRLIRDLLAPGADAEGEALCADLRISPPPELLPPRPVDEPAAPVPPPVPDMAAIMAAWAGQAPATAPAGTEGQAGQGARTSAAGAGKAGTVASKGLPSQEERIGDSRGDVAVTGSSPQGWPSASAGKPSGKQVASSPQSSPAATAPLSVVQKPGLMAPAASAGRAGSVFGRSEPGVGAVDRPPEHYLVFDVETRRSAAEVGGWNRADRMGVSIAVAYDSRADDFFTYTQEALPELFARMRAAQLVVGFNSFRFDYAVLSAFAPFDLRALPGLDLLRRVQDSLKYRVSLDNLGQATLDEPKSADGLQALQWWKEGRYEEIAAYCRKDVDLTHRLYLFGLREGYLLFSNKAGQRVRVPVDFRKRP